MHAEDLANHLQDLEHANSRRCDLAARFIEIGPVKAQLLLQAAEHRAAAARLSNLVVRLYGTPNAGDSAAMVHDPQGPGFPHDHGDWYAMLRGCIDEARLTVSAYRDGIARGGLPAWMVTELDDNAAATERQAQRLATVLQAALLGTTQPGAVDSMAVVTEDDLDALEIEVDDVVLPLRGRAGAAESSP